MAKTTVPGLYIADGAITAAKLSSTLDLSGVTLTVATASTGDNDTTVASTAFVQQEISALVDSSPSALNTLNELAAAIGDDANFSTTVTNSIATKLALAGGTMTGDLIINTTGALQIPVGTTAQRPTAAQGQLRFNTTTSKPEIYNGSAWADVGGGVESVNSATGVVTLDTDDISEGSTNLYFTNARADARIAAATTDDLSEGSTNLYFTTARANSAIDGRLSGSTGVTVSNGAISIGQDVATSTSPTFQNLTLSGTDSIKVPAGTTAQRSGSPANGMLRYNSSTNEFEGYADSAWGAIGGDTTSSVDLYTVTGDGTSDTYDTGKNPQSENNTWVFIGGVYQPKSTYSYSGTQITLSENLPNGEDLEVITGTVSTYNPTDAILGQYNATTSNTASYDTSLTTENENNVFVFIDGVYQPKSSYTYSGSTLTLDAVPTSGMSLEVLVTRSMNAATVTTGFLADDAVTTAKILNANVTADKLASSLDLTGKTVTVATASAGDNDTSVASTAFVRQEITSLVDSAPAAMDTLNELAAALGDDANFSTTVNASIAAKLPLAGGTLTGDLNFGDNDKAVFGAGSDLQIFSDGTDSFVQDTGTGILRLKSNGSKILMETAGGETLAEFINNGNTVLYSNNVERLRTTGSGIDVTGTVTNDGLIVDGNNDIQINRDGVSAAKIFWNRSGTTDAFLEVDSGENLTLAVDEAQLGSRLLLLRNNQTNVVSVSSSGIDVTGTAVTDGLTVAGNVSVDGGTIKLDGNYPTGTENVALGNGALSNLTSGVRNTAIGEIAGQSITEAAEATLVGRQAGANLTTGNSNTFIGGRAGLAATTGTENTAVGQASLYSMTTGSSNTALGRGALLSNTTASNNTAVGRNSLNANTTGTRNVAVGALALDALTTENDNVAIGFNALSTETTGFRNTAVGSSAGATQNGGTNNALLGYYAGANITTGDANTFIGSDCGDATTTASSNVGVGQTSLGSNTTGDANTAVGRFSMNANTEGQGNTAFGYQALDANTTANYNVAIGFDALSSNTTAINNTAVGTNAMVANTTGAENTALGRSALESNTTASNNTAVGRKALQNTVTGHSNTAMGETTALNVTGAGNTAIGREAMGLGTGGNDNVAVGRQALQDNTGSNNVSIGYRSMKENTSGNQCTVVGAYAADAQTSAIRTVAIGVEALTTQTTASNNTAVGHTAGANITTGGSNVIIGYNAASAATTMDTSVIIGDDAGTSITTAGNNTIIGRSAGDDLTTGGQNVIIGKLCDGGSAGASGRAVIGYNAEGYTNNSLTIGYGSTDSNIVFGATTITAPSDIRLKEDIQDEEIGLDFINDLRPVTFIWKKAKDVPQELDCYKDSEERVMNGRYNHGFIAQEVKEVIDKYNFKDGFDMWSESETDGRQRVGETSLMPLMVKAIQELSTTVDELKAEIQTLKGE